MKRTNKESKLINSLLINNDLAKYQSADTSREKHPFFDNLLDRNELAERLGVSPSLISKMMADEGLPKFNIGRAVRFNLTEVVAFLERRRI